MKLFNLQFLSILLVAKESVRVICADSVDVPLTNKLDAPLKATLDISSLNKEIIALIKNEVKGALQQAMEENVKQIIERKYHESEHKLNRTISEEISEITDNKIIAMTGCLSTDKAVSGNEIVKFPNIMSHAGISDSILLKFKSTGMFICNKAGIYYVSVTIVAEKEDSHFDLYRNETKVHRLLLGLELTGYRTATGVYLMNFGLGDKLYIKSGLDDKIYDESSCLTIFRLQ